MTDPDQAPTRDHTVWDDEEISLALARGEHPGADGLTPPGGDTLAELLDRTMAFLRRHVHVGSEQAIALVLWIAHTHAFDAWHVTPYLAITSADKRAGKTTLLEVLESLVRDPWRAIAPTEAATFRKIEKHAPTLMGAA